MHEGFLTPAGLSGGGEGFLFYRAMEGWAEWMPFAGFNLKVASASPEWRSTPERTFEYTPSTYVGYGDQTWFLEYIQDFIEAVRDDTEPALKPEDALAVARTIDAVYESSRTGKRVEIDNSP